jgi:transcriptional regulator with XRE-family HTH domain
MTQQALGDKSGYKRQFVSLVELGRSNASMGAFFDLCGALQVEPALFIKQVQETSNYQPPKPFKPQSRARRQSKSRQQVSPYK